MPNVGDIPVYTGPEWTPMAPLIRASFAQQNWFVDPTNSTGLANDNNTGADALHPVLTYNGGIVAKWGTFSPTLRQDTTLFWLSSQTGSADPVIFTPVMEGAGGTLKAGFIATILGLGPVYNSGAGATITAYSSGNHKATLSGLTGMLASDVGNYMTLSNAVQPGNDGTFLITNFLSATSVEVLNLAGSSPDAGPINWAVRRIGGALIGSGTLSGVIAKNRATPQLLTANIGFNPTTGVALIRNTTTGKLSNAWVYNSITGTTYSLSQPMTPVTLPLQAGFGSEVDTWANGDTFEAYLPTAISIVQVGATVAVADFPTFTPQIQINHISFVSVDTSNTNNESVIFGNSVAVSESDFTVALIDQSSPSSHGSLQASTVYTNVQVNQAIGLTSIYSKFSAGILAAVNGSIIAWSFDNDTILALSTVAEITLVSDVTYGPAGTAFSTPYVTNIYVEAGGAVLGHLRVTGSRSFTNAIVWGPGTLDASGTARLYYASGAGKAVATFINTGGLRLNGQSNANAFNPATGVWTGPLAITATALDATIVSGGFGGLAVNVGGASYTNQGTT